MAALVSETIQNGWKRSLFWAILGGYSYQYPSTQQALTMKTFQRMATVESVAEHLISSDPLRGWMGSMSRQITGWFQAWLARRAARDTHLALAALGTQTLRDIGAGPELLAAAHARDEAARWRRLEMLVSRGAPRDPQSW